MKIEIKLINPDNCRGCPCLFEALRTFWACSKNYYRNEGNQVICKSDTIRPQQCKEENGE